MEWNGMGMGMGMQWNGAVVSTDSSRIFIHISLCCFSFSGVICTSLECEQEDLTCLDGNGDYDFDFDFCLIPLLAVCLPRHFSSFGGKN